MIWKKIYSILYLCTMVDVMILGKAVTVFSANTGCRGRPSTLQGYFSAQILSSSFLLNLFLYLSLYILSFVPIWIFYNISYLYSLIFIESSNNSDKVCSQNISPISCCIKLILVFMFSDVILKEHLFIARCWTCWIFTSELLVVQQWEWRGGERLCKSIQFLPKNFPQKSFGFLFIHLNLNPRIHRLNLLSVKYSGIYLEGILVQWKDVLRTFVDTKMFDQLKIHEMILM